MKSAIVLLAEGFEEIEAVTIIDVLRRLAVKVSLIGLTDLYVTGAHGIEIRANSILQTGSTFPEADALILPGGGPGAWNLRDSAQVIDLVRHFHQQEKWIAAICAAPIVLAKAGILEGKTITAFPAEAVNSDIFMAYNTGNPIEQEGKIITGKGPGTALEFSFLLGTALCGVERVDLLRQEMIA